VGGIAGVVGVLTYLTALLDDSELKDDIAKRFGNSLSQLKDALASHK
jgi:hypothetical protein